MTEELECTIVFQKNWSAIHELTEIGERKWRYIINCGSSRSSKTYSLIDCFDLYARSQENKRLTVWRTTKTDCKKTVMNDAIKHLKKTDRYVSLSFNITESILKYQTTSTFEFHGTDDEETVHGLACDAAWFNEPYQMSRETFDQIDQRTSDFIFIDYNPKKGHWIEDLMKDPRAIVINSTFKDNPFCPEESRLKILSYQPVELSEVVVEKVMTLNDAMSYNLLTNNKNLTLKQLKELIRCRENEAKNSASNFNWCVYGLGTKAEKPNRILRWEEISVEEYLKIQTGTPYIGCDWGKVDPWAIVEVKYYDGNLYVREKNYHSENEIRSRLTHTEVAQVLQDDEGIVLWVFDRLKINRSSEIICDTNRPLKIAMLRRNGWSCFGANKPKGSIIDGLELLDNVRVYYTSDSPNIKYEQENYSRKIDSTGKVLEDPEDLDNHTIDCIRYVALRLQSKGIIRRV